jgi:DNA-binding NarL/FixJ family response regulator
MGIRVIIADDHPMIRQGLRCLLEKCADVEIVGEAENGKDAIECCLKLMPDVAIVDVNMPIMNGIDATRQITQQRQRVKVVAASAESDLHSVTQMLTAGASGYVLKDHVFEELVNAVRTAVKGGTFLSAKIIRETIVALRATAEPLTRREEAMFRGLAEGRYTDEVALDLRLELNTAKEMRRIIECKLAMSNVGDLAMCLLPR